MKISSEQTLKLDSWGGRTHPGAFDTDWLQDATARTALVDRALLARADRILFIAHLALGDYTYLQSCFAAFARAFPHLKIDLWVDERRRTRNAADWPHLKKYALYDWLAECPYFNKVYDQTYSPALYKALGGEWTAGGEPR